MTSWDAWADESAGVKTLCAAFFSSLAIEKGIKRCVPPVLVECLLFYKIEYFRVAVELSKWLSSTWCTSLYNGTSGTCGVPMENKSGRSGLRAIYEARITGIPKIKCIGIMNMSKT